MSPDLVRRLMAYLYRRAEQIGTPPRPADIVAALGCSPQDAAAAMTRANLGGRLKVRAAEGGWPCEFFLLDEGVVLAPFGLRRITAADMMPEAPAPAPVQNRAARPMQADALQIAAE